MISIENEVKEEVLMEKIRRIMKGRERQIV